MASLQEIKTRLSSVKTTRKITKAMQLVATAKLKKARRNLEGIQEYYKSVYDTFQKVLANVDDFSKIVPQSDKKSILYIVVSSDLGLCGSYNSNVFKMLKETVKPSDKIIVIGSKGCSFLKAKGIKVELEFPHTGDEPNYFVASGVSKQAVAMFMTAQVHEIKIIHTKFINSVTFETKLTKILPAEPTSKKLKDHSLTEFEPDPETVIKNAIPLYVSAVIFGSMVESKVSEMSSRRTAMENATDNASDLIDNLDLQYNRARQASITQEITEIIAGSNTNS